MLTRLEAELTGNIFENRGTNGEIAFFDSQSKITVDETFYYNDLTNTLYVQNIYNESNISTSNLEVFNLLTVPNIVSQVDGNITIESNLLMQCNTILYTNQIEPNKDCGPNVLFPTGNFIIEPTANLYTTNIYSSNTNDYVYFNSKVYISNLDVVQLNVSNIQQVDSNIARVTDVFVDFVHNYNYANILFTANTVFTDNASIFNHNIYLSNIQHYGADSNVNMLSNLVFDCNASLWVNEIYPNPKCGPNILIPTGNLWIKNTANLVVSNIYSSNQNIIDIYSDVNVHGNVYITGNILPDIGLEGGSSLLPQQTTAMSIAKSPYGSSAIPTSIAPSVQSLPGIPGVGYRNSTNLKALYPDIQSYSGGVFDGNYVYFATKQMAAGQANLRLVRCKIDSERNYTFGNITSLSNLFESVVLPNYGGNTFLTGGFFDGVQFIHFVASNVLMSTSNTTMVSYDISKPFRNSNSFILQSAGAINSSFSSGGQNYIDGCIYDGSQIYFLPTGVSSNLFSCYYNPSNIGNLFISTNTNRISIKDAYYWDSSTTLQTMNGNFSGFESGTFDGRYLYFAPRTSNVFLRYDTIEPLKNGTNGFETYPLKEILNTTYGEYGSCVFDGRYVYYIPYGNLTGVNNNTKIVRYDTTLEFSQTFAYSNIDTQSLSLANKTGLKGFRGGVFDGKYIYFLPSKNPTSNVYANVMLQYNVGESFFDMRPNVAYQSISLTQMDGNLYGFDGGVWNLKSIYLPPSSSANLVVIPTMAGALTDAYRPEFDFYQTSTVSSYSNIEILRMSNSSAYSAPTSNTCFEIEITSLVTDATANYVSQKVGYVVAPGNLSGIETIQPLTTIGTYTTNLNFAPITQFIRNGTSFFLQSNGSAYGQTIGYNYKVKIEPMNQLAPY